MAQDFYKQNQHSTTCKYGVYNETDFMDGALCCYFSLSSAGAITTTSVAGCLGPPRPVRRGVTGLAPKNLEGGKEEMCVICLLGAQDLQGLIMWGREQIRDPLGHREWLLAS